MLRCRRRPFAQPAACVLLSVTDLHRVFFILHQVQRERRLRLVVCLLLIVGEQDAVVVLLLLMRLVVDLCLAVGSGRRCSSSSLSSVSHHLAELLLRRHGDDVAIAIDVLKLGRGDQHDRISGGRRRRRLEEGARLLQLRLTSGARQSLVRQRRRQAGEGLRLTGGRGRVQDTQHRR